MHVRHQPAKSTHPCCTLSGGATVAHVIGHNSAPIQRPRPTLSASPVQTSTSRQSVARLTPAADGIQDTGCAGVLAQPSLEPRRSKYIPTAKKGPVRAVRYYLGPNTREHAREITICVSRYQASCSVLCPVAPQQAPCVSHKSSVIVTLPEAWPDDVRCLAAKASNAAHCLPRVHVLVQFARRQRRTGTSPGQQQTCCSPVLLHRPAFPS